MIFLEVIHTTCTSIIHDITTSSSIYFVPDFKAVYRFYINLYLKTHDMSSMYNQNYLRYSFSFKDTCSKSTMKTTDHLLLVLDSYLLKRLIPKTDETDTYGNSHRKYYIKHVFLKYLQISQKAPVLESPFRPANLLKETPIQVFSCEICKIFKNTLFEKHLQMTASAIVAFMGSFMGLARDRLKKVLRF